MKMTKVQAEALTAFVVRESLPGEEWRPVVGYEATYAISSLGRVWSAPRPRTPGGLRATSYDKHGYPMVALVQDGVQRKWRRHILVAAAFIGPRPDGMEIRHLDGSRDPRADNLAYGTRSENMRDMVRHGTHNYSSRTHCTRGHPFNDVNTYWHSGKRHCRACRHEQYVKRRARK